MHYNKEAKIKDKSLASEGGAAFVDQIKANQPPTKDNKKRQTERYNPKNKFRKPSFGDEKPSRVVESGFLGLLDNNEVNFLMALTMSLGAMAVASWVWEVPMKSILPI